MTFRITQAKRKSYEASHCSIAVLSILLIASGIIALIVGLLVAKPGLASKNFKDATCRVKSWRFISNSKCDCSNLANSNVHCVSSFPCVQINVDYQPWRKVIIANGSIDSSFKHEAMIRDSETDLTSKYNYCSFHTCYADRLHNRMKIEDFKKKYGQLNDYYLCKYNPKDTSQVIITLRISRTETILSLAIPLSVFVLCLILLIVVCVIVKRKESKSDIEIPVSRHERSYMAYDMPAFEPDERTETNNTPS